MRQLITTLMLMLLLATPLAAAPVDPAWYDISISQESGLADNEWDIDWNGSELYLGHIDLSPNTPLNKIPSWRTSPQIWHKDVTMIVTSSHPEVRLTNVNDPTKFFDIQIRFPFQSDEPGLTGTYTIDSSPYEMPVDFTWYAGGNMWLTVLPMGGDPTGWEGTYSTYFRFRFFVDYDTADEVELVDDEVLMNIIVYFITPTAPPPGQTYFTNILVQRYPTADGIEVTEMQQTQSSLLVGAVTFGSNDDRNDVTYKTKISPGDALPIGIFAFHKTDGTGSPIPYKVHAPSRTLPTATEFFLQAPAKGPADFWQDYYELAISNMNYTDVLITAGNYTSAIKIELIVD